MHASLNPPVQVKLLSTYNYHSSIYQLLLVNNLTINQLTIEPTNLSFEEDMNKIRQGDLSRPSGMLLHRAKRYRVRGRKYARPELKQSNFSKDEDDLILKLHALLGNRWSLIAGRLPGRTDNEVRIHWETYLEKKLVKMGIDPTNHRLYRHTNSISRRFINASHNEHETDVISDQSSSVSESCDMTLLPVSSTNCSEDNASAGHIQLPDLNIGLVPTKTCSLQEPSESSNYGSTSQETLVLFQ